MSFENLSLSDALPAALTKAGYSVARNFQKELISNYASGQDLLITSPMGDGKCTATLIAALQKLLLEKEANSSRADNCPQVIIMTPTLEQANHTIRSYLEICQFIPDAPRIALCLTPYTFAGESSKKVIDILVATPERLVDSLKEETISTQFVQTLIFKNADQLLDAGYWQEMDRTHQALKHSHQTIILASSNQGGDLPDVSRILQRNPLILDIEKSEEPSVWFNERLHLASNLQHKKALLDFLLRDGEISTALVFTATLACAHRLASFLDGMGLPNTVRTHSKDCLSNTDNPHKKQIPEIIIGTDFGMRGTNTQHVTHIVNFNFPRSPEIYFSRFGYLNKKYRNPVVISLVDTCENKKVTLLESLIETPLLRSVIPGLEPKLSQKPRRKNKYGKQKKARTNQNNSDRVSEYSGFMRSNTRREQLSNKAELYPAPQQTPDDNKHPQADKGAGNRAIQKNSPSPKKMAANKKRRSENQGLLSPYSNKLQTEASSYSYPAYEEQKKTQPQIKFQKKIKLPQTAEPNSPEEKASRISGKLKISPKNK